MSAPRSTGSTDFFKVVVVGDFSVGKTSIIKRAVENIFTSDYKITIGVDFFLKRLKIDGKSVDLQLWDVAGHEKFGSCVRAYYRYSMGALLSFDLTRESTMHRVEDWKKSINEHVSLLSGHPIPMILLANKCDIEDEIDVSDADIDKFAREQGFVAWFKTSAKENINIEEAMLRMAEEIMKIDKEQFGSPPVQTVPVGPSARARPPSSDEDLTPGGDQPGGNPGQPASASRRGGPTESGTNGRGKKSGCC